MKRKIIMHLRVVKIVEDDGKEHLSIEVPAKDGGNDLLSLHQLPDCDVERAAAAVYDIIVDGTS